MGHDTSKLKLGNTNSSSKWISEYDTDPANVPAGYKVHLKSDGSITKLKADGMAVGISLGRSLSDHKKTAVLRAGLRVPVRVMLKPARANIAISNYANLVSGTDDVITIGATAFTAQAGAATPGQATFQAATSNDATAQSLAAQINAHAVAGALVYAWFISAGTIGVRALAGGEDGNDIVISYTDNDTNVGASVTNEIDGKLAGGSDDIGDIVAALGAKVYMDDVAGVAMENLGRSTITDAEYASGVVEGYDEDGNLVPCVYVNMPGGL